MFRIIREKTMEKFTIWKNSYLKVKTTGYNNTYYIGFRKEGNPDYLNDLKNTYANINRFVLLKAKKEVCDRLLLDLPEIVELENLIDPICVCVPRSRADMVNVQQYFREAVSEASRQSEEMEDGSYVIKRVKNTCTTHLKNSTSRTDGPEPYPGITVDTCEIDNKRIRGRDVILIDDIYTSGCNIDEDCIQALYDNGANRVVFYAIAYTRRG